MSKKKSGGLKTVLSYAGECKNKMYKAVGLIFVSVLVDIVPYLTVYNIIIKFVNKVETTPGYLISAAAVIGIALWLKTYLLTAGLDASHEVAFDSLMGMRKEFARKLTVLPLGKIQEKGSGSYKKNLVEDIDQMESFIGHMIPEGIPYLLSPLVVFIVLCVIDWRLALLSLGSIPFGFIAMGIMMVTGMKKMSAYYQAEEAMNRNIVEYIRGMEVVKIFNRMTSSFKKYKDSIENYRDFTLDWYKDSWTYMALYGAVLPCTILLLLPVGLHFYLAGTLSLATFLFSLLISLSIGLPLVKLVEFLPMFPQLQYKIAELEKTFEGEELRFEEKGVAPSDFSVCYENVSFGYTDITVIDNVSFTAAPNSLTAIVGDSGSGKSTLAKLLVHFWDVSFGSVKIGGVDIREMSVERLMSYVSYVSQDTFLFNMSIMENIRIGRPDATDAEVVEAAKAAQCHDFISAATDGYRTRVGDSGNKLSGGEKQRITIARAILKDSPIIVLDEATSSTDPENEDKIQEAINSLIAGKTLIIIAHRLSTIIEADKILLINEGRLLAEGTHTELLGLSERYKELWMAHSESIEWQIDVETMEAPNA